MQRKCESHPLYLHPREIKWENRWTLSSLNGPLKSSTSKHTLIIYSFVFLNKRVSCPSICSQNAHNFSLTMRKNEIKTLLALFPMKIPLSYRQTYKHTKLHYDNHSTGWPTYHQPLKSQFFYPQKCVYGHHAWKGWFFLFFFVLLATIAKYTQYIWLSVQMGKLCQQKQI